MKIEITIIIHLFISTLSCSPNERQQTLAVISEAELAQNEKKGLSKALSGLTTQNNEGNIDSLKGFTPSKSVRAFEPKTDGQELEMSPAQLKKALKSEQFIFNFEPPDEFESEFSQPIPVTGASLNLTDSAGICESLAYQKNPPSFKDIVEFSKTSSVCGPISIYSCLRLSRSSKLDKSEIWIFSVTPTMNFDIPCRESTFDHLSISIDSENGIVNSKSVSVDYSVNNNISDIYITNHSTCESGGTWKYLDEAKFDWTLMDSTKNADGQHQVFAKFKDVFDQESMCFDTQITYESINASDSALIGMSDNQAPSAISITIDGGAVTNDSTPDLTLAATDINSIEMYITNTAGCSAGGAWEAYTTSKIGWPLAQNNTEATVYVKFRDVSGNESNCINDTILHDNTSPNSIAILIDGGATTKDSSPDLTLVASDASEMYITNTAGCSDGGVWEGYAPSKSNWILGHVNTTNSVSVKFRDLAGNESSCVSDTIIHDEGPTSISIVIDGNAINTSNNNPVLALAAANATEMYITNISGCGSGGNWESYSTSKANWPLAPQNTSTSVYVKFRSSSLTESVCVSDSIIHDNQAPSTISLQVGTNESTNDDTPNLVIGATGASEMYLTNVDGCGSGGNWESFATFKTNWPLAQLNDTATVYVKFRDLADNVSNCVSDSTLHDDLPPSGTSISVSSSEFTSSNNTSLFFTATGADQMYITNTAGCSTGGSWVAYSSVRVGWGLAQTNATATVYVKFRDSLENESSCLSDTILHDGINPTPPASMNDSDQSISLSSVALSWNASTDSGSGIQSYEISIGNSAGSDDVLTWTDVGQVTSHTVSGLSLTQGNTYYGNVRSKDNADRLSSSTQGNGFSAMGIVNSNIIAGAYSSCATLDDSSLKCWGRNSGGSLGLGDTDIRGNQPDEMGNNLSTVNLGSSRTAVQFSTGYSSTCALLDDSSTKCWGSNLYGKLGLGDSSSRGSSLSDMGDNLPTINLGAGRTASQIIASEYHTCAILDDSSIKCWGSNSYSQLGLGNLSSRGDSPSHMGDNLATVDLGSGRTARQISLGRDHTCALLDNSLIKCWGKNDSGQLGLGDATSRGSTPSHMGDNLSTVDLGSGRSATQVVAGAFHTCALLDNSSVKCWGQNDRGQLGVGHDMDLGDSPNELGDSLSTVNLGPGRTATQVVAGWAHTCAILDNSQLKCWGWNIYGQLGLGHSASRGDSSSHMGDNLVAIDLGSGRTATAIASGNNHMCARLDDSSIKCWGKNDYGQLGLGDTDNRGDNPSEMGDNLPTVDIGN